MEIKCKVCGCKDLTNVFNNLICEWCGAIYDMDDLDNVKDFEKSKLWTYFNNVVGKVKDENKREYIKGLFFGYYDTLMKSEWKKAREWARLKIIDLIQKLMKL